MESQSEFDDKSTLNLPAGCVQCIAGTEITREGGRHIVPTDEIDSLTTNFTPTRIYNVHVSTLVTTCLQEQIRKQIIAGKSYFVTSSK